MIGSFISGGTVLQKEPTKAERRHLRGATAEQVGAMMTKDAHAWSKDLLRVGATTREAEPLRSPGAKPIWKYLDDLFLPDDLFHDAGPAFLSENQNWLVNTVVRSVWRLVCPDKDLVAMWLENPEWVRPTALDPEPPLPVDLAGLRPKALESAESSEHSAASASGEGVSGSAKAPVKASNSRHATRREKGNTQDSTASNAPSALRVFLRAEELARHAMTVEQLRRAQWRWRAQDGHGKREDDADNLLKTVRELDPSRETKSIASPLTRLVSNVSPVTPLLALASAQNAHGGGPFPGDCIPPAVKRHFLIGDGSSVSGATSALLAAFGVRKRSRAPTALETSAMTQSALDFYHRGLAHKVATEFMPYNRAREAVLEMPESPMPYYIVVKRGPDSYGGDESDQKTLPCRRPEHDFVKLPLWSLPLQGLPDAPDNALTEVHAYLCTNMRPLISALKTMVRLQKQKQQKKQHGKDGSGEEAEAEKPVDNISEDVVQTLESYLRRVGTIRDFRVNLFSVFSEALNTRVLAPETADQFVQKARFGGASSLLQSPKQIVILRGGVVVYDGRLSSKTARGDYEGWNGSIGDAVDDVVEGAAADGGRRGGGVRDARHVVHALGGGAKGNEQSFFPLLLGLMAGEMLPSEKQEKIWRLLKSIVRLSASEAEESAEPPTEAVPKTLSEMVGLKDREGRSAGAAAGTGSSSSGDAPFLESVASAMFLPHRVMANGVNQHRATLLGTDERKSGSPSDTLYASVAIVLSGGGGDTALSSRQFSADLPGLDADAVGSLSAAGRSQPFGEAQVRNGAARSKTRDAAAQEELARETLYFANEAFQKAIRAAVLSKRLPFIPEPLFTVSNLGDGSFDFYAVRLLRDRVLGYLHSKSAGAGRAIAGLGPLDIHLDAVGGTVNTKKGFSTAGGEATLLGEDIFYLAWMDLKDLKPNPGPQGSETDGVFIACLNAVQDAKSGVNDIPKGCTTRMHSQASVWLSVSLAARKRNQGPGGGKGEEDRQKTRRERVAKRGGGRAKQGGERE